MQTIEAINKRRAKKDFDSKHHLTEAEEKTLLNTMIQAPTSFNIQRWRFVIFRDQALPLRIR